MDANMTTIIVSLVALVIGIYAVYRAHAAGTDITPELVQTELVEAQGLAAELTEASLTGARAAQQLYDTGKIERDERLTKAFAYVKTFFPSLDQETILTSIESAVFVVNNIAAQVKLAKTPAPEIVVNVPAVPVVVIDPAAAKP